MKKMMIRSAVAALGFLALGAETRAAQSGQQYEQDYARPRDLAALQNDLLVLDDVMATLPQRNRRAREFAQRQDVIRQSVTRLAEQMREQGDSRADDRREGRRYVRVSSNEVTSLRREIAALRDDVENIQAQRRRRGNNGDVVPAGTEIQVMLDQDLSSRSSNPRDRISASTVSAIRLNGRTLIPAGATVSGVVSEVRSKHRGQNDGWLKVDFDSITAEGGRPVAIRSQVISIEETRGGGNDKIRNTGLGALLGGVIGGLIDGKKGALIGAAVGAGGGLLASRGTDDVDLPEGTLLTLRLDSAMNYARR